MRSNDPGGGIRLGDWKPPPDHQQQHQTLNFNAHSGAAMGTRSNNSFGAVQRPGPELSPPLHQRPRGPPHTSSAISVSSDEDLPLPLPQVSSKSTKRQASSPIGGNDPRKRHHMGGGSSGKLSTPQPITQDGGGLMSEDMEAFVEEEATGDWNQYQAQQHTRQQVRSGRRLEDGYGDEVGYRSALVTTNGGHRSRNGYTPSTPHQTFPQTSPDRISMLFQQRPSAFDRPPTRIPSQERFASPMPQNHSTNGRSDSVQPYSRAGSQQPPRYRHTGESGEIVDSEEDDDRNVDMDHYRGGRMERLSHLPMDFRGGYAVGDGRKETICVDDESDERDRPGRRRNGKSNGFNLSARPLSDPRMNRSRTNAPNLQQPESSFSQHQEETKSQLLNLALADPKFALQFKAAIDRQRATPRRDLRGSSQFRRAGTEIPEHVVPQHFRDTPQPRLLQSNGNASRELTLAPAIWAEDTPQAVGQQSEEVEIRNSSPETLSPVIEPVAGRRAHVGGKFYDGGDHFTPGPRAASKVRSRAQRAAPQTPSAHRARSQSRVVSVRGSARTQSHAPPSRQASIRPPQTRPQTPEPVVRDVIQVRVCTPATVVASQTPQNVQQQRQISRTPGLKTPLPFPTSMEIDDDEDDTVDFTVKKRPDEHFGDRHQRIFQASELAEGGDAFKRSQQSDNTQAQQNTNHANRDASSILPKTGIFGSKESEEPKDEKPNPQPPKQFHSGRGILTTPSVIDLCTPETYFCPVPMKERITPVIKKPVSSKKAGTPTPKRGRTPGAATNASKRAPNESNEKVDPIVQRQKRAAELIVRWEKEGPEDAFDEALFGGVVKDQAAEDKKAGEARLARSCEHEEKLKALLEAERIKAEAEAAKKLKGEQEAEKCKPGKKAEEERNKIKRDAERKRAEAAEEREREILREKAQQKIRLERERQAEERAREVEEKRKAKEKADSVQAEASRVEEIRKKQELARQRAASLKPAKMTSGEGTQARTSTVDVNTAMVDDDSLFLPVEKVLPPSKAPAPPRAQSMVPSTAARIFSQTNSLSSYRAEREAEEHKARLKATREQLEKRWKAKAAARTAQPERPVEARSEYLADRPRLAKAPAAKKERPPPKSQPKPWAVLKARAISGFDTDSSSSSAPQQANPTYLEHLLNKSFVAGRSSASSSFISTKSSFSSSASAPKEYSSKVILVSDVEHDNLEKEQHTRKVRERESRRKAKTDEQKAKEAQKRTEAARQKQIQKIRVEALKRGVEIEEVEVNVQVKAFMEKREKELARRAENAARKERIENQPDTLTREAGPRAQRPASDSEQDDELTAADKQRRQTARDTELALAATRAQRGDAFAKAASRTKVADLPDSSDESEEDPDPEPVPVAAEKEVEEESEEDDDSSATEQGSDDGSMSDLENDLEKAFSKFDAPPTFAAADTESLSDHIARIDPQARHEKNQAINQALHYRPSSVNAPDALVRIYIVWKMTVTAANIDVDDSFIEDTRVILEQFLSLSEANTYATDTIHSLRQKTAYLSVQENIKDGLLECEIMHAADEKTWIWVRDEFKACSAFTPETLAKFPKSVEPTMWVVMQYQTSVTTSPSNEINTVHSDPTRLSTFTILEMANQAACEHLVGFLKPPKADPDWVKAYAVLVQEVREGRELFDERGEGLDIDVDCVVDVPWMEGVTSVKIVVERCDILGPLN